MCNSRRFCRLTAAGAVGRGPLGGAAFDCALALEEGNHRGPWERWRCRSVWAVRLGNGMFIRAAEVFTLSMGWQR